MIYSREFVFNDVDYKLEVNQGNHGSARYIVLKSTDPEEPEKGYIKIVCTFKSFEEMDTLSGILSTTLVPDMQALANSLYELARWDKRGE